MDFKTKFGPFRGYCISFIDFMSAGKVIVTILMNQHVKVLQKCIVTTAVLLLSTKIKPAVILVHCVPNEVTSKLQIAVAVIRQN